MVSDKTIHKAFRILHIVSWEPEGRYCRSKMFLWEPEGRYRHTLCTATAPFWFSMEHLWIAIMPFWLSTDDIVDIGWYQLSISTFGMFLLARSLLVRLHPVLRGMHAMQSLYLSHRGQQAQPEFLISLKHRRPILYFSLVLHRISLFNSVRLLTLWQSSWISRCVRRQHTFMYAPYNHWTLYYVVIEFSAYSGCGSHSSSASGYFEVQYRYR